MATVETVLGSKRIFGVFARVRKGPTMLSDIFGWGIGGNNTVDIGGREFNYDTFNVTRKIGSPRHPGQASATTDPQPTGTVRGTFPRAAETVLLEDEQIHNLRRSGGPLSELDSRGEQYITKQEQFLAQKAANIIEFQTAAMFRGSYTHEEDGDDLFHDFTGTGVTIDFQLPANNQNQLNGIIDASWATAGTDIPDQLHQINEKSQELTGMPITNMVMNRTAWGFLINNTKVINQGGSSNVVFETLRRDITGSFTAVLRAIPWLKIHIIGHGLEVGTSETYTKLIADDQVTFFPDPDPSWVYYANGSEIVTEGPNGVRAERMGIYPYAYPTHDPSGFNLTYVQNGVPNLIVPEAIFNADVTP